MAVLSYANIKFVSRLALRSSQFLHFANLVCRRTLMLGQNVVQVDKKVDGEGCRIEGFSSRNSLTNAMYTCLFRKNAKCSSSRSGIQSQQSYASLSINEMIQSRANATLVAEISFGPSEKRFEDMVGSSLRTREISTVLK